MTWFREDDDGKIVRHRGTVTPTRLRNSFDPRGHASPRSGRDRAGSPWRGTSRIIDRPARRRTNRLSWRKTLAAARRTRLESSK